MAKLSANGTEIGTLEFVQSKRRYMSNGYILENKGFGWKRWGKVKPDYTPQQAFERAKARQEEALAKRPASKAYRDAIFQWPVSKRWKITMAFQLLGDDVDGVWSELAEGYDRIDVTIDDVIELARLRAAAIAEGKELANDAA